MYKFKWERNKIAASTGFGEGIGCDEIGTGAGREEEWI